MPEIEAKLFWGLREFAFCLLVWNDSDFVCLVFSPV
jgi:hypothetical protein